MDERMKKDIEAVVTSIFSEKEETEARQKTEDALTASANTIEDLTTSLEGKNSDVVEMESKISEADERIATLESELEAAKTEVEASTEKLSEAEDKIEDMVKDKAADERMADLEGSGVARSDKATQREKVREMSDEDFTSYKEELVSIREAVLAEIKEAAEAETETADSEEEEAVEEKAEGEEEAGEESGEEEDSEEEEGEVETPAANIDPGQAVAAAMNMEIYPSDDLIKKYGKLGDAMAATFKMNKDEV